ncbi:YceK/YidQ family lipoprotein [Methylicorpusculum sp.]|uniref:YceK/YidQ family lipoprotein n=1 Tax=Methylicorpusculum sp. TaxID=2713644 RepID=UPI00271DF9D7|nr:YceK/YidQ family lipoprotein [Methylicorpusculum sp.]MDO8844187.1 YceK/YidQ family lipoprotein [Methylicorpusculum sp.]MDP2203275.1 YceK/YidQ family lipoprotein [Methylicorpusculum sp.]
MFKHLIWCAISVTVLSGCATFKTLETDSPLYERVFIYSGTRLDWAAIVRNDIALSRFKVIPPRYPIVDLPLSFALDSLFLPLTVSAEIFH